MVPYPKAGVALPLWSSRPGGGAERLLDSQAVIEAVTPHPADAEASGASRKARVLLAEMVLRPTIDPLRRAPVVP